MAPPLAAHLNYLGVDTVIVCGESTSGCVRASVVDGCTYRYRVTVVEECVFDRHETAHAMNLFDMNQKYADVLSLGDVLEYLAAWSAERKQGRGEVLTASFAARDTAAVAKRPLLSRPATRDRRPLRNRHSRESGNPGGGRPRLAGSASPCQLRPPR